ncbi:MAG: hypothetical protein Q8L27_04345 [archaeon]|nr:hypothetical protein [archaeon]
MRLLIYFCVLAIFFSSFSSAFDLKIQPSKLSFDGDINENLCSSLTLLSDSYSGIIDISDKWSKSSTREINEFNLDSSEFGINLDYETSINFNEEREVQICLRAMKTGEFYGVILVKPREGSFGIGVWVKADIRKDGSFFSLTGDSVLNLVSPSSEGDNVSVSFWIYLELFMLIFCLIILVFMCKKLKNKGLKSKKRSISNVVTKKK